MKRVFSHSEFSTYQQCPKKWWFKYHERLMVAIKKNALSFGGIIHSALESYYIAIQKDVYEQEARKIANETFAVEIEAQIKKLIQEGADEEQTEELKALVSVGESMLMMYFEYAHENDTFKVIAIEDRITVPVEAPSGRASTTFEYVFIPDMIVYDNGGIWIVEDKTAKTISSQYFQKLALDDQITRYCWGLEKFLRITTDEKYLPYKNMEVKGVYYNILKKKKPTVPILLKSGKGISRASNIDTTADVYLQAITDNGLKPSDYENELDALQNKKSSFFHREVVNRNSTEKEECRQGIHTLCRAINTDPAIYRCPGQECGWKCDYRNLCIEDTPESRSLYEIKEDYKAENDQKEVEV